MPEEDNPQYIDYFWEFGNVLFLAVSIDSMTKFSLPKVIKLYTEDMCIFLHMLYCD